VDKDVGIFITQSLKGKHNHQKSGKITKRGMSDTIFRGGKNREILSAGTGGFHQIQQLRKSPEKKDG